MVIRVPSRHIPPGTVHIQRLSQLNANIWSAAGSWWRRVTQNLLVQESNSKEKWKEPFSFQTRCCGSLL